MARLTPPVNDHDHIKGPNKASLVLVEYGDLQCPHCGAAYPIVKALEKAYAKSMRFAFRHFPLSEIHQYAEAAAIATEAAGRQGKFWEMHDMIFEHQAELNLKSLGLFAESLALNMKSFEKDLSDQTLAEKVAADFESGIRSGVNGTPSFFINGVKYNGSYDFASMANTLDAQLHEKQK